MTENAFEKHGQSILAVLIAGLLAWAGLSISQLRETAIRVEGRMAVLDVTLKGLESQLAAAATERYRSTQAAADFALRDERMEALHKRVSSLESWAEKASPHISRLQ